jgi:hypothetical protein
MIEEIWHSNPDMRFGQLLINLGIAKDDFNTWINEDADLEKWLESMKKEWVKKIPGRRARLEEQLNESRGVEGFPPSSTIKNEKEM